MNLIVVSDIFGNTEVLTEFTAQLSPYYSCESVIDPYRGQKINFKNEKSAYQHFQQYCGLKKLTELLKTEIKKSEEAIDILGFSVGGTSAWEVSAMTISKQVRNIVCFYASRIRDKTNISPLRPTSLIFHPPKMSSNLSR